jgi:Uma2 family endonuclease
LARAERLLDTLELPEGYRAELVEGAIMVTSSLDYHHTLILADLNHELTLHDWRCSWRLGVAVPLGKFIPDLTVAQRAYFARGSGEIWQTPEGIAMVVEVTSTHAFVDRDPKRRGYAAAGIPLYLLFDPQREETVLFSEPQDGDYNIADRRPISEPIPLPEPFSFTLEGFTN